MEDDIEISIVLRSRGQAQALSAALDVYSRICAGQLAIVTEMVRDGTLPLHESSGAPRRLADVARIDAFRETIESAKEVLGYPANGNMGIGHDHLDPSAKRAYEVKKVLDKALAEDRDPDPAFRGVSYDGLMVRYTADPEPSVTVEHPTATLAP